MIRLKAIRNPLPTPPRLVESHGYFSADRTVDEPMSIVNEDSLEEQSADAREDDRFQLSPIPTTATLPVSNLPNRQNFRPLTAEDSDIEDLKSKRPNAYMRRSVDPIQIRPPMPRMSSTSSIRDQDMSMARSIPRSTDVHMASCSSSPNTSFQYNPREKERNEDFAMTSPPAGRPSPRRPSVSSTSQLRDHEELERERSRVQLRELLELQHLPNMPNMDAFDHRPTKPRSPDSSGPVTRNPSPDSNSSAKASQIPLQNSLLQRPGLSRASTAALQAERARTISLNKESSTVPSSASQTSPTRDRDRDYRDSARDAYTPTHPQLAPQPSLYHARRPSVTGSIRGRSSTSPTTAPPPPSGLSRQFWAMQQQQAQRV